MFKKQKLVKRKLNACLLNQNANKNKLRKYNKNILCSRNSSASNVTRNFKNKQLNAATAKFKSVFVRLHVQ